MDENTRNIIIHRWHRGQSQRQIAKGLHISRNTIQTVLNDMQRMREGLSLQEKPPSSNKRKGSLLDAYDGQIRQALDHCPHISIINLQAQLRSNGYQGSYTILHKRVKQIRQAGASQGFSSVDLVREVARIRYRQIDIELATEGRRPAFLFTYELAYSGRIYARLCAGRDLATTLHEHVLAFEHLGGVAISIRYYCVPLIVERLTEGKAVYIPTFLRFANHYGFQPLSLIGEEPQEGAFGELLHAELVTQVLQNNRFRSLHHANDVLTSWVARVADHMPYRESRPIDLYQSEKVHLIPLPTHPWPG